MKKLFYSLGLILMSSTAIAQTQLVKWFAAPNEFSIGIPMVTTTGSTGILAGGGYNCYYEDGNVLFYVAAGAVFDANSNIIGALFTNNMSGPSTLWNSGNEIGIIPHPDNFTNLCSRKYFLLYDYYYPGNPTGDMHYKLLDLNLTPPNQLSSNAAIVPSSNVTTNGGNCPLAISPLNGITGNRYIYYPGPNGIRVVQMNSTGAFSFVTNMPYTNVAPTEMELSNAGDQLAFTNNSGQITIVQLNLFTGLPLATTPTTIVATTPRGLEFDNSGTQLFYSDAGAFPAGVYVFSSGTSTPIPGTTSYASGMLEKSSAGSYILCGNSGAIKGIDPNTYSLSPWTATGITGDFMPDMIDGEWMNASPMVTFKGPLVKCSGTTATLNISMNPNFRNSALPVYINGAFGNLYTGNSDAIYSLGVSLTGTSSSYQLIFGTGPCAITKSWTIYKTICGYRIFNINWHDIGTGPGQIYGRSADPGGEASEPGFGYELYLQELDPETNEPIFTIAAPSCWNVPLTQDNYFNGFDPIANTYSGEVTSFSCGTSEGKFLYDRNYLISRATWSDVSDWEIYSEVVNIPSPLRTTNETKPLGATMSPDKPEAAGIATGIASASVTSDDVQIYPNPTTGVIQVKTKLNAGGMIGVYDMMGNKVHEKTVSKDNISTFDLSGFARGVYMLNVRSRDEFYSQRILLK
jgi:hypothetical protein